MSKKKTCSKCGSELKKNVVRDLNYIAVGFKTLVCINPNCEFYLMLKTCEKDMMEGIIYE